MWVLSVTWGQPSQGQFHGFYMAGITHHKVDILLVVSFRIMDKWIFLFKAHFVLLLLHAQGSWQPK